jgi:hypothetical protein
VLVVFVVAAEVDEKSEYSSERKRKEEETRFFFMAAVSAVDGGGCVDSDFQRERKSLRDEERDEKVIQFGQTQPAAHF